MLCGAEEEDYIHLFRCQKQRQWRADFEIALEAHLKKRGTAADLRTAIVTNVRRWLNGGTQVASCQDEVGTWHEFIKGYICRSWSEQQEGFYREHEKDPIHDTGELWTAALIGFLWQWSHQLWTKRNEETHKADGNRGSAREKLEAESRTRALYEQAAHLIVEDREMFAMPLQERLQQPTKGLLAWVAQVTPSVKVGLLEAQTRIRDKIRDIREFFRPIT
jgi:hypothetical protein